MLLTTSPVDRVRPGVSSTEEKEPVALPRTLSPAWSWRRTASAANYQPALLGPQGHDSLVHRVEGATTRLPPKRAVCQVAAPRLACNL